MHEDYFVNTEEVADSFRQWKDFDFSCGDIWLTLDRGSDANVLIPEHKLTVEGQLHQRVFAILNAKKTV